MTKKSGYSGSIRGVKVYRMKQQIAEDQIDEEDGSENSNDNKNGLKIRLSIDNNEDIMAQLMKINISEEKRKLIMSLIMEEEKVEP